MWYVAKKSAKKHLFLQYEDERYTINLSKDVAEKENIRQQMQKIYTPGEDSCWKTPESWNDNILNEKMKKYND